MIEIYDKVYLDTHEASELLNIKSQTIIVWRWHKKYISYTSLGGKIYYDLDVLKEFMNSDKYKNFMSPKKKEVKTNELVRYEVEND